MNSRGIAGIVIVVVGLLIALYIIVSVLSGFGNVIGATYKYFLPTAFVLGAVAPKASMYLLILCGGYIDFFKKLMGIEESLFFTDVFFILGVPPVLLLGMCCGVGAAVAQGKVSLDRRLLTLLALSVTVVGVTSVAALIRTGANLGTLKELANSAAYFGLIFALPALFPRTEDVFRLLRFFVYAMIPAAFHGLYHSQFGLLDFEETYMLSGLSMNTDYIFSGEGIFGPFASQGALSGTLTIAATVCAFAFLAPKELLRRVKFPPRWAATMLMILFLAAAILSLKRFPVAVFPFTIIGYFLIRSKFGTVLAYAGLMFSAITLVAMSEHIAARLPVWQQTVDQVVKRDSYDPSAKMFRIRTLNTRMEDFAILKNPENWQPFGAYWFKNADDAMEVHSLVVKTLLRYGWVPLLFGSLILIPVAGFLHWRLVQKPRDLQQRVFIYMTSLAVSIFLTAALGAAFIGAFPIPLFFGMAIAMAVTTGVLPPRQQETARSTVEEAEPIQTFRPPMPGRA